MVSVLVVVFSLIAMKGESKSFCFVLFVAASKEDASLKTHTNYSQFADGEEPVTRTFRLSKADWDKLLSIREQLLASHGIKLSMNATFIHLLHLHEKHQQANP